MNDNDHFFRMVLGHQGSRHTISIEVLMNKKNLPLKWKHTKINGKDNEYNVELDFIGDNPSWSNPSRREPTGGNIFGGRKEICICTFDVEEAVSNGVKIFDVHISGLGETDKSHDGTVHLPGTGG